MNENNMPTNQTDQKKKFPVWAWWFIGIVGGLILVGLGYLLASNQYKAKNQELQNQIDELQNQESTDASASSKATSDDPTADWETYTDKESGFSFKYPTNIEVNVDGTIINDSDSPLVLYVGIEKMSEIEFEPLGYDPENAEEIRTSLKNGDPSPASFGIAESVLSLENGAVGEEYTILGVLVCDSIEFQREAMIFYNDYRIIMDLYYGDILKMKSNNIEYFVCESCCKGDYETVDEYIKHREEDDYGDGFFDSKPDYMSKEDYLKTWGDGTPEEFVADIKAGKTDSESQQWYGMFNEILSTLQFN